MLILNNIDKTDDKTKHDIQPIWRVGFQAKIINASTEKTFAVKIKTNFTKERWRTAKLFRALKPKIEERSW